MATQVVFSPLQVSQILKEKKPGTSRFRGVHRAGDGWVARIKLDGIQEYLGIFDSEIEAAKAYDERAKIIHGPYARLNFPAVNHAS
jgi:hypothetical protein